MKYAFGFRSLYATGFVLMAMFATGCGHPFSIAMHDPIFPTTSQPVTFSLEMQGGKAPKQVRLYERTATINSILAPSFNTLGIPGPFGGETLLQTWNNPALGTLSFTRSQAYPNNTLVNYRFEITQNDNKVSRHEITFTAGGFPGDQQAIPVYVTGSVDKNFDVVFIPDTDITDQNLFRQNCRGIIRQSFFDEPTTRIFRRSFNFYINPRTGTATDYDKIATDGAHKKPSNWGFLSFAEGKVLLHRLDLRDYAGDGIFSSEQQNRGTILHESGHGLFGLADEYGSGSHWEAESFPNNWDQLGDAQAAAPSRGKTSADARQMGTSGWYKLCVDNCQMLTTGLNRTTYDRPCADRIINQIVENSND